MTIRRIWEMPNAYTFGMESVRFLFRQWAVGTGRWVDPFCGRYSPATITNDADENNRADFHMDGLEFLKTLPSNSADGVLFDPPYSCEQALRTYKPIHNGTAGREEYHARCMDELSRICRPGGIAIRFAWNSCGLGGKRGFDLREILMICHGAAHNDTIITVEEKSKEPEQMNFG